MQKAMQLHIHQLKFWWVSRAPTPSSHTDAIKKQWQAFPEIMHSIAEWMIFCWIVFYFIEPLWLITWIKSWHCGGGVCDVLVMKSIPRFTLVSLTRNVWTNGVSFEGSSCQAINSSSSQTCQYSRLSDVFSIGSCAYLLSCSLGISKLVSGMGSPILRNCLSPFDIDDQKEIHNWFAISKMLLVEGWRFFWGRVLSRGCMALSFWLRVQLSFGYEGFVIHSIGVVPGRCWAEMDNYISVFDLSRFLFECVYHFLRWWHAILLPRGTFFAINCTPWLVWWHSSALAGIYVYLQTSRTRFESHLHCLDNT